MKWMARLERRFGRFAVPNVTLALIIGQVIAFFAANIRGVQLLDRLQLVPDRVLAGEVWRLVTFVFMPPSLTPLWAMISWLVLYLVGTSLEQFWGTFKYNVYIVIFLLASIAAAMIAPLIDGGLLGALGMTGFLPLSLFLAFAHLFPNFQFMLFFILPIKVKWLALVSWIMLGWTAIQGGWGGRAMVLATVLNFFIFFGQDILWSLRNKRRRRAFESRVKSAQTRGKPRHRCVVCGLTSKDDPKMQFRYCSQCEGQLCYCMNHLRQHDHVTAQDAAEVTAGKKAE